VITKDAASSFIFTPRTALRAAPPKARIFATCYPQFQALGWEVFGVSRDSVKSHENFKARLNLPFALLADGDETVCELYRCHETEKHVWQTGAGHRAQHLRHHAGRPHRLGPGGVLKSPDHAREVLEFVRGLA
jgi:peroxiredoxin Q/BCP